MELRQMRSHHLKTYPHFAKSCSPSVPSGQLIMGHSKSSWGWGLWFSMMGRMSWLDGWFFIYAHPLNALRYPHHQGDQGLGICWVLEVDDCDSQQWAGGDWEVGICLLQVPCTHHNPPALKAIDDEDFKECLNLKNCEVLKWDQRVCAQGIYVWLIMVSTRNAWVCTAFCPTQFFTVCGSWLISIPYISLRGWMLIFLPSIQSFPFTSMWRCWSLPSGNWKLWSKLTRTSNFSLLTRRWDVTLILQQGQCECDNIHSWISLTSDLTFSQQHGIYSFKFPKRFLEISSRDLTLFSFISILIVKRPDYYGAGNNWDFLGKKRARCEQEVGEKLHRFWRRNCWF